MYLVGYNNKFGEEIGTILYYMLAEWVKAKSVRNRYYQLFAKEKKIVELLNECDGSFFALVQRTLWESCTLSIAKLSDRAKTAGKKNISVNALAELDEFPFKHDEFKTLAADVVSACESHQAWRKLHYAHLDLDIHMGTAAKIAPTDLAQLDLALHCIFKVINYVHEKTLDTTIGEEVGLPAMEVQFLMYDAMQERIRLREEIKSDWKKLHNRYPSWLYGN